jgi:alkanesulfonate monooxygenase SsuD/methylene tetrahydromethanopterin reductase-like flavin-dependent oxidoreductase (luciferase family)
MRPHPFRFGVICEHTSTAEAWSTTARHAEELGFSTLFMRDHFTPEPFGDQFAHSRSRARLLQRTTTGAHPRLSLELQAGLQLGPYACHDPSCSTDRMLPAGSLNQAISGP